MKINLSFPATGCQKLVEIADELKVRPGQTSDLRPDPRDEKEKSHFKFPAGATFLREAHGPGDGGRHPRRRVQGLRCEDHRRKRQAGLPHEAGNPDQRSCEAPPEGGTQLLQAQAQRESLLS